MSSGSPTRKSTALFSTIKLCNVHCQFQSHKMRSNVGSVGRFEYIACSIHFFLCNIAKVNIRSICTLYQNLSVRHYRHRTPPTICRAASCQCNLIRACMYISLFEPSKEKKKTQDHIQRRTSSVRLHELLCCAQVPAMP